MSKKFTRLCREEQGLFDRKQAAWNCYISLRNKLNKATREEELAWQERCSAKELMEGEFELLRTQILDHEAVWEEYRQIRDRNSLQIRQLKAEADDLYQEMQTALEQLVSSLRGNAGFMKNHHCARARLCEARMKDINAQVDELKREIKKAKRRAEKKSPYLNRLSYNRAKTSFNSAKTKHEVLMADLEALKREVRHLKNEFQIVNAEHIRIREEIDSLKSKVK